MRSNDLSWNELRVGQTVHVVVILNQNNVRVHELRSL